LFWKCCFTKEGGAGRLVALSIFSRFAAVAASFATVASSVEVASFVEVAASFVEGCLDRDNRTEELASRATVRRIEGLCS